MSRYIVTGAAGFVGSHLVEALLASGHLVIGIDNFHRGRPEYLAHLKTGHFDFHQGDIRDYPFLAPLLRGAEAVFHLAAQSSVMNALDDIEYSTTTNVNGTCNVLRAASEGGVQRFVFASSREVYGEPSSLPVTEDEPLLPKNPYGASKAAAESYCRAWHTSFGLECQILRFSNLYGPRDAGRVIPIWMEKARRGEDLVLYGGDQVMDFLWIEYAVRALIAAAACDVVGPINVGSGRSTTLPDLGDRIIACFGESPSRLVRKPARNVEINRFTADVTRMQQHLGVRPDTDPLSKLPELAATYVR